MYTDLWSISNGTTSEYLDTGISSFDHVGYIEAKVLDGQIFSSLPPFAALDQTTNHVVMKTCENELLLQKFFMEIQLTIRSLTSDFASTVSGRGVEATKRKKSLTTHVRVLGLYETCGWGIQILLHRLAIRVSAKLQMI